MGALCEGGAKGLSGNEGEGGWEGREGRVRYDCLPWYNYLAFDIMGTYPSRCILSKPNLPLHL